MEKKSIVNLKGAKEIAEEMKNTYEQWLAASGLTEVEFLKMADRKDLKIRKKTVNGSISIEIGFYDDTDKFFQIGLNFLYEDSNKEQYEKFKVNLSFLFLFIAGRLDEAYNKKYGQDYFFKVFSEACYNLI